jgi:hypothetical protein
MFRDRNVSPEQPENSGSDGVVMPFTPAHPAIVLPFLKLKPERISATALVIGSIAPDFEYFFKMSVNGEYSHTLLGIFYFNIPVAILMSLLFHEVVKRNLIANLPVFFQYRFQPMQSLNFKEHFKRYYWVVIISAALGSLSHIFWDAFTHNDGFFAQRISLYKQVVIPFDGVRYPLFYGLQHISTYVGLTLVLTYIVLMKPEKNSPVYQPTLLYWLLVGVIASGIVSLRYYFATQGLDLGNFVVSAVSAILIAILISGFVKFKRNAVA